MNIIERITLLMEEKNINKSELSKQSNIPYTTIDGLFKKGTENIKLSTLNKLADYFKVSVDYLIGKTNIRNHKTEDVAIYLNDNDSPVLKYFELDSHGKKIVDTIIDIELERLESVDEIPDPRTVIADEIKAIVQRYQWFQERFPKPEASEDFNRLVDLLIEKELTVTLDSIHEALDEIDEEKLKEEAYRDSGRLQAASNTKEKPPSPAALIHGQNLADKYRKGIADGTIPVHNKKPTE